MHKKTGVVFVGIGAVLILSALLLFFYNEAEEKHAEEAARTVMAELHSRIDTAETVPPETEATLTDAPDVPMEPLGGDETAVETEAVEELPAAVQTLWVAGYEYMGYLQIPVLGLELPVIAEWSEARLKVAPCRHFGSTAAGDLVIAGHNYRNHFGSLPKLTAGDMVTFTDVQGKTYLYEVGEVTTMEPTAVEEVRASGWELILYTCNYTGKARILVGCREMKPVQAAAE